MSVSGEQLVSLLQAADQSQDQSGKTDDDLSGGAGTLPSAGFTVKTRDELGQKIFINVCSSPLVPLPPTWPSSTTTPFSFSSPLGSVIITYLTAPQNLNPSSRKQAEAALAIPMHLSSPPRSNVDHEGNTCTVLDCVIHPDVLQATTQNRTFKMFLVQLALGQAEETLGDNRQLDPHFKLPKMRSKGDLAPLDISLLPSKEKEGLEAQGDTNKLEKLLLPGDVASTAGASLTKKKVILIEETQEEPQITAKGALPQIKHVVRFLGSPKATAAEVTMHLPRESKTLINSSKLSINTGESIEITSSIDSVNVTIRGYAPVRIQLPLAVDADKVTAVFSPEKKTLTLTLPFISFRDLKSGIIR